MRARDDGPSGSEPRQLEPRHQLDRRASMPPRNRLERRYQAHEIAERARSEHQHAACRELRDSASDSALNSAAQEVEHLVESLLASRQHTELQEAVRHIFEDDDLVPNVRALQDR